MGVYRRYFRLSTRSRRDIERELDEEIEAHLAMRVEDLVRQGATPERAREEALRRFGDLEAARRRLYASARIKEGRLRWIEWLESLVRDGVLAARLARRSPGFTALAIATFALGIGLTTATFTVVDRVLLRALPFPEPGELVALASVDSTGAAFLSVSTANWHDWKDRNRTLESIALHSGSVERMTIAAGGDAFRVPGREVSGSFFDVLGTRMLVGRPFTEAEVEDGAAVAVVSEGFWRRVLGGDPDLARGIVLNGIEHRVLGVVPAALAYPEGTEVWLPRRFRRLTGAARNNIGWRATARLRPGVAIEQARADLSAIARRIREAEPVALYSYGVGVVPLREAVVGNATTRIGLLMGAVSFVLLIACANLAGLNFARTTSRNAEIAMRAALGAPRRRLVRQLATEHVLLALTGGALGVAGAWAGARLLASRGGEWIPRAQELGVDGRIVLFGLAVSLGAGLAAVLLPAIRASRASPRALVGGRGVVRGGRGLPGALLVGGEVAMAVLLLTGSGLLVRSFRSLLDRDPGFDPRGVVTAEITLNAAHYGDDPARWGRTWGELLERLRRVPGVQAAAVANWIPTGDGGTSFIQVEGVADTMIGAGYQVVSDDYFRALGIPLLRGRVFDERDDLGTERVAVVNRSMVEAYWPDRDPIGRRVRAYSMEGWWEGEPAEWLRVVGVVGDVRHDGFEDDPAPAMYVLHRQVPYWTASMTALVRAPDVPAAQLVAAVRRQARAQDPALAVDIARLEDRLHALVAERRLVMSVLSAFGALALLLAAIGVYGLVSFGVTQRTHEIGVRTALGAERTDIVRMVVAGALRISAIGAVLGLVAALSLTRLMNALLVDVRATDPVSYLLAAAILLAASALAALVPAWRAARVDPLEALRTS